MNIPFMLVNTERTMCHDIKIENTLTYKLLITKKYDKLRTGEAKQET